MKTKKQRFTVSIDAEIIKRIDAMADSEERSRNYVINRLLNGVLNARRA